MGAFWYFHRTVRYAPCPRCGEATAIGFAGEDPAEPTPCTRCRGVPVARANAARSDLGPCARCQRDCVRYGRHGSPLCASCKPLAAYQGDRTG